MERYVIQADLFMPHLIIASCDGGWLILMGWQPSILSMDLQQGAFNFSELAMIFSCILKRMFWVYGAYQPCSIYFHDGPVQMHVAAETPRAGAWVHVHPSTKYKRSNWELLILFVLTLGIDISVSNDEKEVGYQCQFYQANILSVIWFGIQPVWNVDRASRKRDIRNPHFKEIRCMPLRFKTWNCSGRKGTRKIRRGLETRGDPGPGNCAWNMTRHL